MKLCANLRGRPFSFLDVEQDFGFDKIHPASLFVRWQAQLYPIGKRHQRDFEQLSHFLPIKETTLFCSMVLNRRQSGSKTF
jgi:hypothetical protein